MRRSALLIVAGLVLSAGSVAADSTKSAKASARRSVNDKGTMRQCQERSGKRSCRRVAVFQGHGASRAALRSDPLDRPSGEVWLRAENLGEEFKGNIYKDDGSFDDAVLARLDELWRDPRTGDVRAVRAELYEHLSRVCDRYPGQRVDLVSGFRLRERDSSRHHHASAMDIRIKGIPIRELYRFAESLDIGSDGALGIGIYPNSQFIHIDFRAPGEPSYRWTDLSGPESGKGKRKKSPGRTQPARKPVS
jgi:uncharacterized protein YcbK (DUF882 family)